MYASYDYSEKRKDPKKGPISNSVFMLLFTGPYVFFLQQFLPFVVESEAVDQEYRKITREVYDDVFQCFFALVSAVNHLRAE